MADQSIRSSIGNEVRWVRSSSGRCVSHSMCTMAYLPSYLLFFMWQAKVFVYPVKVRGIVAGRGSVFLNTGQSSLIEHGAFTTHHAVLVGLYNSITEGSWVTDMEYSTVVVNISIVSIRSISAAEGGADVTQQEAGTRGKVQRFELATQFLIVLLRGLLLESLFLLETILILSIVIIVILILELIIFKLNINGDVMSELRLWLVVISLVLIIIIKVIVVVRVVESKLLCSCHSGDEN